jgi:hypothetical protein
LVEAIVNVSIADAPGLFPSASQPAGEKRTPVFLSDGRDGLDLLDMAEAIRPIAELCAHRDTQTPLMLGVVGPPGAGKSFALERLRVAVDGLATAGGRAVGGVFVGRIVTVPIDAAAISGDAATAIATAAFAALVRDSAGVNYAALADEAANAGADPYQAANKALERHDDVRRRLDAERQSRDDVEARRARLVENVLYETAGSRVDSYARARRGQIEARLRRFDLAAGDSTANFKGLVRDLADAGWGARAGAVLSSIWAYRSQRRLLLAAIVFLALAFGVSELQTPGVMNWLRGLGPPFGGATDWLAARAQLAGDVVAGLVILGVIALAVNLWRALFFAATLFRGARLLAYDMRERQRDLDAASARLNRRIAALTAETEAASRQAEAAEKRANMRGEAVSARAPTSPFADAALAGSPAARAFFSALSKIVSAEADRAPAPAPAPPGTLTATRPVLGPAAAAPTAASPTVAAPERLLLIFDNLDALAPARALDLIETAHSLLGPSFIAAFACDAAALAPAVGGATLLRTRLDKLFQLTFNAQAAGASNGARLIGRLIGGAQPPRPSEPAIDATKSALSEPLSASESSLLGVLAPLAANTPRGVKRFLNAYRVARTAAAAQRPALALMLALGQSGDEEAAAAMDLLLAARTGMLGDPPGPPALAAAVRSTRAASDGSLTIAEAIVARDVARRYQSFA